MKRMAFAAAALLLALCVAACSAGEPASSQLSSSSGSSSSVSSSSSQPESAAEDASSEPSTPTAEPQETASQPESAPSEESAPAGGTLIAYFSWSGNTEAVAQMIQAETGGELFAIAPATPYTEDYNTLLDVAQQEQAEDARPELAAQVENWDSCDVVFVGYPDWWSDAPMVVYSFLEAYDWTGKTLVPFCTSGGSGFGRSLDRLPESASGAAILEGLHVNGDSVEGAGEEVAAWLDGLGL